MLPIVIAAAVALLVAVVALARARRTPARPSQSSPLPLQQRWLAERFECAEGARDYKLYLPATRRGRLPLLVMLHGCLQDADDFAAGTGMNELADAGPFLVVYPEQPRSANPRGCWNWFRAAHQERDRGEPAILAGLVRRVMAAHDVDPARVYVAGMSAGGGMAVILAATYPELFAAAGVHSGVAYKAGDGLWSGLFAMHAGARQPERHAEAAFRQAGAAARVVPLIVFHGDRDRVTRVANARQIASQWARLGELASGRAASRAAESPGRSADGRGYRRAVERDADGATLVETWIVHGLGHAWSGGRSAGSYTDPAGPSASAEMVRFFGEHTRAARLPRAGRGLL